MTIYVDPYHTTAGVILDMTNTITPLKECTVRDPLTGTNLSVRTENGIVPVFITGCRDSERAVRAFTHPIFVKNFNGKSYLFTDMTLFVKSGGTLDTIDAHIRHREEFEFTKARAIASLVWAGGDVGRFKGSMDFAGDVFAAWMGQSISRSFSLDFMATSKIQMLALAYWESLFKDGPLVLSEDDDVCMVAAQKASRLYRVPVSQAIQFYRSISTPIASISDFCDALVKTLDNVNLSPIPGRPDSGFNVRVLFNLIADAWYSTNSKQILATAVEHPPTMCAIIYYCANYNNFRRQQLGQTIQSVGRGGKGDTFSKAFSRMIEEFTSPQARIISVMEYMDPSMNFDPDASAVDRLLSELTDETDNEMSKVVESNENSDFIKSASELWETIKTPGVSGSVDPGYGNPSSSNPISIHADDTIDGRPTY